MTQPDDPVLVSEGTSLELKCNYSYRATPYLFWYVQYPRQRPQLLLKYFSGNTVVQGIRGFLAELKNSEFSFNLRKLSAHWSDSAEYFCALSGTVPGTAGGVEHKPLAVVEFSDTQDHFLFYFKQSFAIWLQMRQRELSRQRYFYVAYSSMFGKFYFGNFYFV